MQSETDNILLPNQGLRSISLTLFSTSQLQYNDGDRATGSSHEMAIAERMHIAVEGMVIARQAPHSSSSLDPLTATSGVCFWKQQRLHATLF